MRSETCALAYYVCGVIAGIALLTITPAMAHDALIAWADTAHELANPENDKSASMIIEDRFVEQIAAGGTKAETACSGSIWVYDYLHHIAAGSDGGPEMILYIGNPPTHLPSRNLSHVSTLRGVHLGDSVNHVATALSVPLTDINRSSEHRQLLDLRKPVHHPGDNHIYYDLLKIVFQYGRVASIWLAHNEN